MCFLVTFTTPDLAALKKAAMCFIVSMTAVSIRNCSATSYTADTSSSSSSIDRLAEEMVSPQMKRFPHLFSKVTEFQNMTLTASSSITCSTTMMYKEKLTDMLVRSKTFMLKMHLLSRRIEELHMPSCFLQLKICLLLQRAKLMLRGLFP